MMRDYPESYGDGTSWVERGELFNGHRTKTVLVLFCSWANLNGEGEEFGEKDRYWFEKFRDALGGDRELADYPQLRHQVLDKDGANLSWMKQMIGIEGMNQLLGIINSKIASYFHKGLICQNGEIELYTSN